MITDIKREIIKHFKLNELKDLLNFLSIDRHSFKMQDDYDLWLSIAIPLPNYPLEKTNINNIKFNLKHYKKINDNVHMLIRELKLGKKININEWLNKKWLSFVYLQYHLNMSHINELYNEYKSLNEHIYTYGLNKIEFKKLYLYRSATQLSGFALTFVIPSIYNSPLRCYTWDGLSREELFLFLFHFFYYININPDPFENNKISLIECLPIQTNFYF